MFVSGTAAFYTLIYFLSEFESRNPAKPGQFCGIAGLRDL
jgi:hypothetical protein